MIYIYIIYMCLPVLAPLLQDGLLSMSCRSMFPLHIFAWFDNVLSRVLVVCQNQQVYQHTNSVVLVWKTIPAFSSPSFLGRSIPQEDPEKKNSTAEAGEALLVVLQASGEATCIYTDIKPGITATCLARQCSWGRSD